MAEFARIHAVKKKVQAWLLSIPGVQAVGVGAKIVAGRPTKEPCIAVFLVKKRSVSIIRPSEPIPPEIDGIKTDVIEMDIPRLHANHNTHRDRPVWGGPTIQAGGSPEYGTLGCLGLTTDSQAKVVAITCQHVVAPPVGTTATDLVAKTPADSPNPYIAFSGQNTPGSLVVVKMGSASKIEAYNAFYTTTDSDTPQTIAKNVLAQVNTLTPSAGVTVVIGKHPEQVQITTDPAFDTEVKACSVYDVQSLDKDCQLFAAVTNDVASTPPSCTITLSGKAAGAYATYTKGTDLAISWSSDGTEPTYESFLLVTIANPSADPYQTAYNYLVTFYPRWFAWEQGSGGPCNRLIGPDRISPLFHSVVAVNDDTLYAGTFIGAADELVIVTIPDTKGIFSVLHLDQYGALVPKGMSGITTAGGTAGRRTDQRRPTALARVWPGLAGHGPHG